MKAKDIFMYALAGLVITYAFLFLFFLLFKEIPAGNRDVVITLSGIIVGGGFGGVLSYFFGSTKGSSDKTALIANSTPLPKEQRYEIPDVKLSNDIT